MIRIFSICLLLILFFSCSTYSSLIVDDILNTTEDTQNRIGFIRNVETVLSNALIPSGISAEILENIAFDNLFTRELTSILNNDLYLYILVDKQNPLRENYAPDDLIELRNRSYVVSRAGLMLRRTAASSLEDMAAAARLNGLTLTVSSAYRSYENQSQIYARNVNLMGRSAADRVSARAGHSQHQLGLVVDFGSITNEFARTAEGRWVAANASRFGWSLSYPQGYEHVTGYSWESWHYRYTGIELAVFIDKYFEGIQQYALRFIHEWKLLMTE